MKPIWNHCTLLPIPSQSAIATYLFGNDIDVRNQLSKEERPTQRDLDLWRIRAEGSLALLMPTVEHLVAQTEDSVYKECVAKLSAPKKEEESESDELSAEEAVESDYPQGDLSESDARNGRLWGGGDGYRTQEEISWRDMRALRASQRSGRQDDDRTHDRQNTPVFVDDVDYPSEREVASHFYGSDEDTWRGSGADE